MIKFNASGNPKITASAQVEIDYLTMRWGAPVMDGGWNKNRKEFEAANLAFQSVNRAPKPVAKFNERGSRQCFPCAILPEIGAVVNGKTVTGYGACWTITDDMASIHGSMFLGHEGEKCCYVYFA